VRDGRGVRVTVYDKISLWFIWIKIPKFNYVNFLGRYLGTKNRYMSQLNLL